MEIKVSNEPAKTGLLEQDVQVFAEAALNLKHIRIGGIMTIAPYFNSQEESRPYFRKTRKIFERLKIGFIKSFLSSFLWENKPQLQKSVAFIIRY